MYLQTYMLCMRIYGDIQVPNSHLGLPIWFMVE